MAEPLLATTYLQEHGHLPMLGEEPAPWRYKGFLLYYVQFAHASHPNVSPRWPWYLALLHNREIPDEPVPEISFSTAPRERAAIWKNIEACMRILTEGRYGSWEAFRFLCEWIGFALGTHEPLPTLDEHTHEALYRTLDLGPWLTSPGDHLGEWLADQKSSGWNPHAFYPTPHDICELMAQFTIESITDALPPGRHPLLCECHDPCIGTGRILLHVSGKSLRLSGQDVDGLVLIICKINGALYAPWLSFPIPQEILAELLAQPYPKSVNEEETEQKERLARMLSAMRDAIDLIGAGSTEEISEPAKEEVLEIAAVAVDEVEPESLLSAEASPEPKTPPAAFDKRGQGLLF